MTFLSLTSFRSLRETATTKRPRNLPCITLFISVLSGCGAESVKAPEGSPTFSGPIPITEESAPFGSAMEPGSFGETLIKRYDYVEEEYFLSGTADVYGPGGNPVDNPDQDPVEYIGDLRPLETTVRRDVPYATRAMVLRPKDKREFSGNVHLIPFHNVGASVSVDENLLRNGDIWMGVEVSNGTRFGVQAELSGGVAHLLKFDAKRYGKLTLPGGEMSNWPSLTPERLGEAFKTLSFGGSGSGLNIFIQEISRGYAQAPDILTQTAALLRSNADSSPLSSYKVRRLYTTGGSGQSTILKPYVDFHHDPATARLGHPPFDGYVILVGTTPTNRPEQAALVMFQSEGEAIRIQPPKPAGTDNPKFRYYEIPGTGHVFSAPRAISTTTGDVLPEGVQGLTDTDGKSEYEPYDKINLPILWGVWHNLYRWIDEGIPMPPSQLITRDPKANDKIARDQFGNALGGLRTPWVDVPDARYVSSISEKNPLRAGMNPFTEARMESLYGSREAYLKKLAARFDEMAEDGWILTEDIPVMLKPVTDPKQKTAKAKPTGLSADSTVGAILADPAGKAILIEHWGEEMVNNPMMKMAHGASLRRVAGNPFAKLSKEKLQAIDKELRALK